MRRGRDLDAIIVLNALADHIKPDRTYWPTASQLPSRWNVHTADLDWELLCTGSKLWDTRAECGGGGAVDLVTHLHRITLKAAVALLKENGL